jgi:hypothetical protein
MSLPPRIFIALGDRSEISSLASDDLGRKADQQTIDKLKHELRDAKERLDRAEGEVDQFHRQAEAAKWWTGLFIFLIAVSAITLWLWLKSKDSGLPPPPIQHDINPPPSVNPPPSAPRRPPASHPSNGCGYGCNPLYYREYKYLECWRNRSIRGPCFD